MGDNFWQFRYISYLTKEDNVREILSHEQVQARTYQRRLHVFKIVVFASIVAPLAGELTSYLADQSYSAVLPSSLMISLSGVITYLWCYRSGMLDTAIIINAIIQIGSFSWGALVAGGTRSEQFFYLSLFPVLNGFFLGRRAALITTIYTVIFAITLGALEHKGLIAVHQPHILAITFQTVACLFIIGWLTMTYEGERSRNEKELSQLVEVKGSLNRYYDNTLEGAGLGTWDWMLDTKCSSLLIVAGVK